jgi:hypothetical protein
MGEAIVRRVVLAAVSGAVAVLAAGCGSHSSTASSTPTLSTPSATTAASTTSALATVSAAPSSSVAAASSSALPGTATSVAPTGPPIGPREQALLAALHNAGITPSSPGTAVEIASFVCQAVAQKTDDNTLVTMVNAMVGSDAQAQNQTLNDAQMTNESKTYIAVAKSTYCS